MTTIVQSGPAISSVAKTRFLDQLAQRAVLKSASAIKTGQLVITDGSDVHTFGSAAGRRVQITVNDRSFYGAAALGGSLGASEAYLDGLWDCDDIGGLIALLLENYASLTSMDGRLGRAITAPLARIGYWLERNTRAGSRRNIVAHYDLGNDFFELFLDPTMTYSSAIFEPADLTLEQAQIEKIDRACRRLELTPSHHVLEIGTGWGSAAIHMASTYGCRVTTTTISPSQHAVATERVRAAGLEDHITIVQKDYRDLEGEYDRVLSIEMIEAVGHQYLGSYFEVIGQRLKSDGMALIQAITIRDQFFDRAKTQRDFLKKYIFPGSCLLSISAMNETIRDRTDMTVRHMEDIGRHYATTLSRWRDNFEARLNDVRALGFDDRFIRMWRYYLGYCEGAFMARHCSDVQMLLTKPGAQVMTCRSPHEAKP